MLVGVLVDLCWWVWWKTCADGCDLEVIGGCVGRLMLVGLVMTLLTSPLYLCPWGKVEGEGWGGALALPH